MYMKNSVRTALLLLGDIVMLSTAFGVMLAMAFPGKISREIFDSHFKPFLYVFLIWILVLFLFNLYETASAKPTIPNLKKIGLAFLAAFSLSLILFYIIPDFGITPKTNLLIFSVIFIALFVLWRRIFYGIFAANFRRGVIIVSDSDKDMERVAEITDYLAAYPQAGFFVRGIYSSFGDLWKQENKPVDTLIISKNTPMADQDLKLVYSRIGNVIDLAYAYEDMLGKIPLDFIDKAWFLHNLQGASRTLFEKSLSLANRALAFLVLIITSPIMAMIALLIKLEDSGPIFYSQMRVGRNGKNFKLYKFRSMTPGADRNGAEWTEKNDPRITKTGKIIRRLHVDEIPQFWNIFKGEMALVGPRPELPSFVEKLEKEIPFYGVRHIITPGFTGWAQIKFRNARGIAESKEKFEYDLYYIKNRNIFMDLGIFLRTISILFTHD